MQEISVEGKSAKPTRQHWDVKKITRSESSINIRTIAINPQKYVFIENLRAKHLIRIDLSETTVQYIIKIWSFPEFSPSAHPSPDDPREYVERKTRRGTYAGYTNVRGQ